MKEDFNKVMSPETIRRIVLDCTQERAVRKPLMASKHRKPRLGHLQGPTDDWTKMLFMDEKQVDLFHADGNHSIRRPFGKQYTLKYIRPTVKFNGGNIMCRRSMSKTSVGPLVLINSTTDAVAYKNVMETHMLPSATQKMPPGWMFYEDNLIQQITEVETDDGNDS